MQKQEQPKQEQEQPRQEQATPPSQPTGVGASIKAPSRNPLDMIKRGVPLLSQPKQRQQQRPLSPLIDAAGRDESCVWYRVRQDVQWQPGQAGSPWWTALGLRGNCSTSHLRQHGSVCNPKAVQGMSEMPCCLQSYNMGNKTNLLVAVRQPEGRDGPTNISLTTDHPTAMVLHWGVRRGTRSVALPSGLLHVHIVRVLP